MAPKVPKSSDSYQASLKDLRNELPRLISERERIDARILLVRQGIATMEGLVSAPDSRQSAKKGLTNSVRDIMRGSDWLAPPQILEALRKQGIEVGDNKNILVEVHMILKRLLKSGEVELDGTKFRKPVYRGKK